MNDPAHRSDKDLFEAAASGDRQALADLATRHSHGLYDFALRGTLDEEQAAEVVEAVFDRVRQPVTLPGQIDFRTWLYSLGLIEVLAVSNETRTARISTDDERFYLPANNVDIAIAQWAWQAARGLRTRDYCVLDLTLRRGLTPEEVAEAASLTRSNLYASIGRARGAFEETFAAMLLFEHGRDACSDLDEMVEAAPGTSLRPALRHQIIEHSDDCDNCRRTLDSFPLAANVYVSLANVEMPEALTQRVVGPPATSPLPAEPVQPIIAPEAIPAAAAAFAAGSAALEIEPDGATAEDGAALHDDEDEVEDASNDDVDALVPAAATEAPVAEADEALDEVQEEPEPAVEDDRELALVGATGRRIATFGALEPAPAPVTPVHREAEPMAYEEGLGDRVTSWVESARGAPLMWTYALLGVLAVLAIYLGVAVADSIQDGGDPAGPVPLDSPAGAAASAEIDCGDTPIEMDAGTSTLISFDQNALEGYAIQTLSFQPVSENAAFDDLEATLEDPFSIRFAAKPQEATAARSEEYALRIQWQRGDETATSSCELLVNVKP